MGLSMSYNRIVEVLPNERFVERVRELESQGAFAATIKVLKNNLGYELTMLVPTHSIQQTQLPLEQRA